jgi:hypothetical protein
MEIVQPSCDELGACLSYCYTAYVLMDAYSRWQERRRDASQQRHYKSDDDASPVVRNPQQSITKVNVLKANNDKITLKVKLGNNKL